MADVRGSGVIICDERCGCPTPCPGSTGCRCAATGGGGGGEEHKQCPCGDHCGCNPCDCPAGSAIPGVKSGCQCGANCTCTKCAS